MYRALYSRLEGVVKAGLEIADDDVEAIREIVPEAVRVEVGPYEGIQRLYICRADGTKKICAPGWVVKTLKAHHKEQCAKHRRPVNVSPPEDCFSYPHELLCCGLRGRGTCLAALPPVIQADFTVSCLVKVARYGDPRAASLLLDSRPRYVLSCTDGWWSGWAFEVLPSGWWSVRVGLGHAWHSLGNLPRVEKDAWTSLCLTYTHSSTTLHMYVNGVLRCEERVPRVVHATSPLRAAAGPHGARGTGIDGRMRKVTLLQACVPPAGPTKLRKSYSDLRTQRRFPTDEAHALDALLRDARRYTQDARPQGDGADAAGVSQLTAEVARLVGAFERVASAMEATVVQGGGVVQGAGVVAVQQVQAAAAALPAAEKAPAHPPAKKSPVQKALTHSALHQHRAAMGSPDAPRVKAGRAGSGGDIPPLPPVSPKVSFGKEPKDAFSDPSPPLLSPSVASAASGGLGQTIPMRSGSPVAPLQKHLVQPVEIVPPSPSHWSPTEGIREHKNRSLLRQSTEGAGLQHLRVSSEKQSISVRSSVSSGATMLSRWKSMMLEPAEGQSAAEAWDETRTPSASEGSHSREPDWSVREAEDDMDDVPAVVVDLDKFTLGGEDAGGSPFANESSGDFALHLQVVQSVHETLAGTEPAAPASAARVLSDGTNLADLVSDETSQALPAESLPADEEEATPGEGGRLTEGEVKRWLALIRERFPPCYSAKGLAKPAEVRPGLFFGDAKMGKKVGDLASRGVKKVVNLAPQQSRTSRETYFGSDIEYMEIDATDDPAYPIMNDLAGVVSFVEEKPCFVHCFQGVNRSAAILAGYIMCIHRVGLLQAVRECHQARPVCFVGNDGFIEALIRHAHKIGLLYDEDEEPPGTPLSHLSRQASVAQEHGQQKATSFRSVRSFRSGGGDGDSPLLGADSDRRLSRRSTPVFDLELDPDGAASEPPLPQPLLGSSPQLGSFTKHGRRTQAQQPSVYHSAHLSSLGRSSHGSLVGLQDPEPPSPPAAVADPQTGKPSPLGYAYTSGSAYLKDRAGKERSEDPDPIDELMPAADGSPQTGQGRSPTRGGDGASQGPPSQVGQDSASVKEAQSAGASEAGGGAAPDESVPNIDDLFSPIKAPVDESPPQQWPRRRMSVGEPLLARPAEASPDLATLDDIFSPVEKPQQWPRQKSQGSPPTAASDHPDAAGGVPKFNLTQQHLPPPSPPSAHSGPESVCHTPRAGRRATASSPIPPGSGRMSTYSSLPSRHGSPASSPGVSPVNPPPMERAAKEQAGNVGRRGRRQTDKYDDELFADLGVSHTVSRPMESLDNSASDVSGRARKDATPAVGTGSNTPVSVVKASPKSSSMHDRRTSSSVWSHDNTAPTPPQLTTTSCASGSPSPAQSETPPPSGRRGTVQGAGIASRRGSNLPAPLEESFNDFLDGFDTSSSAQPVQRAKRQVAGRRGYAGGAAAHGRRSLTPPEIAVHAADATVIQRTPPPAGNTEDASPAYSDAFATPMRDNASSVGRSPPVYSASPAGRAPHQLPQGHLKAETRSRSGRSSAQYSDGLASYADDFEAGPDNDAQDVSATPPRGGGGYSTSPGRRMGLTRKKSVSPQFGINHDFVPFDAAPAPAAVPAASPARAGRRAGRRSQLQDNVGDDFDAFAFSGMGGGGAAAVADPHPAGRAGRRDSSSQRTLGTPASLGGTLGGSSLFSPTGRADRDLLATVSSPASADPVETRGWPGDSDPLRTELSQQSGRSSSWDTQSDPRPASEERAAPAPAPVPVPMPAPAAAPAPAADAGTDWDDWDEF